MINPNAERAVRVQRAGPWPRSLRKILIGAIVASVALVAFFSGTREPDNAALKASPQQYLVEPMVNRENPQPLAAQPDSSCPNIDPSNFRTLALQFAPWLYFDNDARDFPMNAQAYLDFAKGANFGKYTENTDINQIHTYFFVATCGDWGQVRIVYWWFYGNQKPCILNEGVHRGDWEHIVVILKWNQGFMIDAVRYSQHAGDLTKLRSGVQMRDGRPIVYVGKIAHGSYPDQKKNDLKDITACHYFADKRKPATHTTFDVGTHPDKLFQIDLQNVPSSQTWMNNAGFCRESSGCQIGTKPQEFGKNQATINAKYCSLKACDSSERGCEQSECINGEHRIDISVIAPPKLPNIGPIVWPAWPVRPACCKRTCVDLGVTTECFIDPRKCSDRDWTIPQYDIPPLTKMESAVDRRQVGISADAVTCPRPSEGSLIKCGEHIYLMMRGKKKHITNDDIRRYLFEGATIKSAPQWACNITPNGNNIIGHPRIATCGGQRIFFDGHTKTWFCDDASFNQYPWRAGLPTESWDHWRCGTTCNSPPICASNPSIADASPQCYDRAPDGSLIKCQSGGAVYIVMRGHKHHITNGDIFNYFFQGVPFTTIPDWLCNKTPSGRGITGHPRLTWCSGHLMFFDGTNKAWFCNWDAFNKFPWKAGVEFEHWDTLRCAQTCNDPPICNHAVQDTSPQCLNKPPPGLLFDCDGGGTKYLMMGGYKKHITNSDIFNFLFHTHLLRSVPGWMCNGAPNAPSIINHPRAIRCYGKYWFYDGRSKMTFCNQATFNQYPFRHDRIETWTDSRCNSVGNTACV